MTKIKMFLTINDVKTGILIKNIFYSLLIKGGAVIVSLLSLPAYLIYFPQNQILGFWFTALTILSWLLTFDLGLGNGLRNKLVHVFSVNDHISAKKYISSAYFILTIISILLTLSSFFVIGLIDWNKTLNIPEEILSREQIMVILRIIITSIMLQMILRTINSILFALQKAALNSILTLVSSLLILVFVKTSNYFQIFSGNILVLSICYLVSINLPLLIATLFIFRFKLVESKPSFKYVNISNSKKIINTGFGFLWIQLMFMLLTTTNEFFISFLSSSKNVVEYQIYYKVFSLFALIFTVSLSPVWSMITKAITQKDVEWIKKCYYYMKVAATIIIFIQFASILFLQYALDIWLDNNSINVNLLNALNFALLGSLLIWNSVVSSIANGLEEIRTQSILLTIAFILKIPLAFLFTELLNSWIGVVIATNISLCIYCFVQPYFTKKMLDKLI